MHQQIRLVVASDGPHVIFDGRDVFQVHANMGKWFPLIVERRQRKNLPIVINSQHALQFAHLLVLQNVQIMQTGNLHNGLIAITAANQSMHY